MVLKLKFVVYIWPENMGQVSVCSQALSQSLLSVLLLGVYRVNWQMVGACVGKMYKALVVPIVHLEDPQVNLSHWLKCKLLD